MKLLLATAATLALTTSAYCGTVKAKVTDRYTTVYTDVPYTKNKCVIVDVPVYGNVRKQGNAAEGALLGMILGGVLGGTATNSDQGAAVGAVMGGIIGADKGSASKNERVVTGYKQERRCEPVTYYKQEEQVVYDYSIIEWVEEGKVYSFTFDKKYREVGE
tara:strand:+ start:1930 stop:2412 length:483 start_codon:yes stop_codon:yes gene_type:complete